MFTLNGIGHTLYGKKDKRKEDRSYITTKWFVIIFFPIIPIARYRVIAHKGDSFLETKYDILEELPLDKNEIFKTYFYGFLWVTGVVLLIIWNP